MRIYRNCVEAITDIGRELKKCAIEVHTQSYQNKIIKDDPNMTTKEIQAFEFMVVDTSDKDEMPGCTLPWLKAEFKERVSEDSVNPGEAYKLRPEVWNEFLVKRESMQSNDDAIDLVDKFDYTYNERLSYQLKYIIDELRLNPETRQAIIEVHNNIYDLQGLGGRKRIPCSLLYQFMIRDGALDVIYIMRSSDFATHFQNDIWLAAELRNYVAAMLGIPQGKFFMFVSSLHCYKRDWQTLSNY